MAHLGFIQDAIARMANEANTLKAWLVPVVTAAYGYAVVGRSWTVAALGIAATLVFGWQSAHYLQQEKAYRALYVETLSDKAMLFDMSIKGRTKSLWGKESALRSWSIWGFFGAFTLAGIAALVCAIVP